MRPFLFIFVLFFSSPVTAEVNVGESIEWRTVDSTVIVRGTISSVTLVSRTNQRVYEDVTIAVREVLKGSAGSTVTFRWTHMDSQQWASSWRANNTEVVFFLVDGVPDIEQGVFSGRLMPRTPFHPELSFYDLSALGSRQGAALRADFSRAATSAEVLARIRAQVQHLSGRTVNLPQADARRRQGGGAVNVFDNDGEFRRLEVPVGSEAGQVLNLGSVCYLVVPDARFLAP
jgi:hypothetical protein